MQAITPDAHGAAVLLLTLVALFLFTRDRLPLETSSLTILILLVAGFQIFPYEKNGVTLGAIDFFAGFGNEALVAICALLMVGKALETTGALQPLATIVSRAFHLSIVSPATGGLGSRVEFDDTGTYAGNCTLTCHNVTHVRFGYGR